MNPVRQRRRAAALAAALLVTSGVSLSAAAEGPGPDTLASTPKEQRRLEGGKHVFLDVAGVRGEPLPAILFRVRAAPDAIWRTIGAFESYPLWIESVQRADVYLRDESTIGVAFEVHHWLIGELRYSVKHDYRWPDVSWGTFTLDDSRPSDLESASGFWRTYPVDGDPTTTDVLYAADLHPSRGVAKVFRRRFVKAGLRSATEWLKRESESREPDVDASQ